jgi:CelD/BcsL family acetyltransferase involved in cellulose biosynthesis
LENEWRTLEQRCHASFFMSWDWVGALLDNVQGLDAPQVLRIKAESELKGLALIWRGVQRRQHGLVRSRSLHLNETGCPDFDRVTVEHNGILAPVGEEMMVLSAALNHLAGDSSWDEFFLSGLGEALAQHMDEVAPLHELWHHRRWTKRYHFIDLAAVRHAGGDYLDSLSNNSRYQARRALKGYAALGPLQCRRATSAQEALAWLEDLMRLHQAHWNARGEPGAFSSDFTRRFHTDLVTRGWPRGTVSLLRASAGTELLGYVYNFERNGIASNYQSGHVAAESNKLKPGLVVHCLAVQEALQRGLKTYDLLMGGDHFKPSLCNASGEMTWSVLQQPRMNLRIEHLLRDARDRWRSRHKPSEKPAAATVENQT